MAFSLVYRKKPSVLRGRFSNLLFFQNAVGAGFRLGHTVWDVILYFKNL
ncbi:hypothetical protein [Neobacillus piezotolerans]|nr:hypothetical protein [Neobacillus piezotolerans]